MDVFTIEDIFDETLVKYLLNMVNEEKENFKPLDNVSSYFPYFDGLYFMEKFHSMLNQIVRQLMRPSFVADQKRFECALVKNFQGKFDDINDRRQIGFMYHFYKSPRRFTGGEMIYMDSYLNRQMTLEPKRNTVMFYDARLKYTINPIGNGDLYTVHGYICC